MIQLLALAAMANAELPPIRVQPLPLGAVRLLDGPFLDAEKRCTDYLLELDPERLLHGFRKNAGLEPKAPIYGGWENAGLAGHSLGHVLTALSQSYSRGEDARFKAKIDAIVQGLTECQKARPDGCISAIPGGDRAWEEIRRGEIRSQGFDLNGLWAPWYTHHKVLAGLLDAHESTGSKLALDVARRFADWAIDLTKSLDEAQWKKMLACEYGGMNEALAELYARTGEKRYLDLARRFYDKAVLDPLAAGRDELQGRHANTQIPKLVGLARLYELEGQERDRKASEFFWKAMVGGHTYVVGGNSNHEYLGPPGKLSDRLSTNTAETCNTYNMLRLSRKLFSWEPRADIADFVERATLNHILASQNPADGMMTYFLPLSSGASRSYSSKFDNFTCCHGSGMESHTKHGDHAYFVEGKKRLWVSQFIASEATWQEAGVTLRQETAFPLDGRVMLKVVKANPTTFELLIRHPYWAPHVEVTINGKVAARSSRPSSFISLERLWKAGDVVEFDLPFDLRTEAMPDNPNRVALMAGPLVLAADMGGTGGARPRTPVLVSPSAQPQDWLERTSKERLEFRSKGSLRPGDLPFKPFYTLADRRYAVYFDRFSEEGWRSLEESYREDEARRKDIEARTIDSIRIGEMQPERDHHLVAERCDLRGSNGGSFRTPMAGGWFELRLKVDPAQMVDLVATYWGSDRHNAECEILVDGALLIRETLPNHRPNEFFDETRPIPEDMTKGKEFVTLRVRAIAGKPCAAVNALRIVRRA